jgi:hypothetical protein
MEKHQGLIITYLKLQVPELQCLYELQGEVLEILPRQSSWMMFSLKGHMSQEWLL